MSLSKTHLKYGLVKFKGTDAEKFLQGQLTSDVTLLNDTHVQPGAYCSPQGRIRANFIALRPSADEILMILPLDQVHYIIDSLKPYVAFFQTEMTDVSTEFEFYGLTGTEDEKNQHSENIELKNVQLLAELPTKEWQRVTQTNSSCFKLSGSDSRWLMLIPNAQTDILATLDALTDLSQQQWQEAQLRSGHVWIDASNRDQFLPHDISLPALGAVSFTKGCYAGQEIVARMHYRGDPKYHLVILDADNIECDLPQQLVTLTDEKKELKIGKVVSKLQLEDNSWCITASIKKSIAVDETLVLFCNRKTYKCRISLPTGLETNDAQGAK